MSNGRMPVSLEKAQHEARSTQLQAELEKSGSEKARAMSHWLCRRPNFESFGKRSTIRPTYLGQQQEFTARAGDVRDLVVARNLHIIDVHDRDGDGKSQRAFGRIFYTEGKSLIFYAYDLGDPRKVDAKVSFYVWGGRLGAEKPVEAWEFSTMTMSATDAGCSRLTILMFWHKSILSSSPLSPRRKAIREPGGRKNIVCLPGRKA